MGTNVLELIERSAPKKQATTADVMLLASGGSTSSIRPSKTSSASRRTKTKSSTSRSSSKKVRPPCKYGPRDADGYCPKKPLGASSPRRQTSANRTKVTARTTSSATTQAIDVVTNPRASSDQKAAAVAKVAETAATAGLKAGAKKVAKSGRVQKAKDTAANIAKKMPVGGVGGPFVTAALQVLSKMPSEQRLAAATRARKRADAAVKKVESELRRRGQTLPKKQRNILLKQHIDYYLRNP